MATLEEMLNNMTIIYNKNTGNIKGMFTGIHDILTLYGEEGEDYALIWDSLVVPRDEYVMNNLRDFKINTELQKLELINASEVSKYI